MGRALYRTYRSKNLAELVGQEHITTALDRALKKGTISHAYLFTGPRGTGKTSLARILAHEINGLPYTEDGATHLDIIEIDAASNRRIDEIRDLRDKVHTAPTSAKYKVYIIDEVHMLTKEAFNALLKTLEEPPAHVVFMLATTEAHKLPETIISRTQRFSLKPVDLPKVVGHLKTIAKAEKINIDDDAMELIAQHGEGSFRDSISLLDQARNSGDKVSLQDVQNILGIAPDDLINQIIDAIATHNPSDVVQVLGEMHDGGYQPAQVARQLGQSLRSGLISGKPKLEQTILMQLLSQLINVPASTDPKSFLEISLIDASLNGQPTKALITTTPAVKVMPAEVKIKPAVITEPHPSSLTRAHSEPTESPPPMPEEPEAPETPTDSTAQLDQNQWPEILQALKAKHNTVYSVVRTGNPHFEPGKITLEFSFAFHQKRMNEAHNKQLLADTIQQVTGQNPVINCKLGESNADPISLPPSLPPSDEQIHEVKNVTLPPADTISNISNIFGGAELIQS